MATRVTDLRNQGSYQTLDDRLLVLDFQAGEPEAFVEIHRRYGGLARHVCLRFLPNRQDADEAFQETMIRVFQGLHRFNGRYALQPWVARIATNVSLDQIRTRTRRPLVEDGLFQDAERRDPADGPEEAIERLIERDLVISVLSDLPESHRTALVLRELEGRSHREIADKLDITPAQAKALIHRAKGSFRRNWLIAITEKGGVTGIALLPLLWLAKVADGARRVVERVGGQAGQVAQAATPEIVTSASAASSPAVAAAATTVTERFVAAGMTLLLAGGVTVGAATVVKERADRQPAERVVAEAPPPVVGEPEPTPPPVAVVPAREEPRPEVQRTEPMPEATESPLPVIDVTPTPAVDPSPTVDPSPSPSEEPSPSPITTVPPAPAWSYEFVSSTESVESCSCEPVEISRLSSSNVERLGSEGFSFSQIIHGAALDVSGDAAWPFYLLQNGEVTSEGGRLEFRFGLSSAGGAYLFGGTAVLAETIVADDGSVTYRFDGTFDLVNQTFAPVAGVPYRGFITLTVGVWQDGTIYTGSLSLDDTRDLPS